MNSPHISIIIPAFNEERRILPSLHHIDQFLKDQTFAWEVIIVDDGSTDNTAARVKEFIALRPRYRLLQNPANMGKGISIKRGMLEADGDYRLFTDADLSTPIEDMMQLIAYLEPKNGAESEYQVVIGSRRIQGAHVSVRQPFFREAAGRVFSLLVRTFLLHGFLDTQCGFKLFTAEAAKNVFSLLTIHRFGFDIEILFVAQKIFGYKIKEAPVEWVDSPASKVNLAQDSLQMFVDIFRVRWRWLRGVYRQPHT